MKLSTVALPELPRLAWIAIIDEHHGVRAFHGASVETGADYVVEGVWDAPFAEAQFHRGKHFFGSGLRVEGNSVWIVPSHALVDRLFHCKWNNVLVVSNSLAVLMAFTGARLDPSHHYGKQTTAILAGVSKYEPDYPVQHPDIRQFYQAYRTPIIVTVPSLQTGVAAKPDTATFETFREYADELENVLKRLDQNVSDDQRMTRMNRYTMASSGYDSTCVSVLVRDMSIVACYTARRSRKNVLPLFVRSMVIDDGTRAAQKLGYRVRYFRRPSGSRVAGKEIYFFAPSADGCQLLFHSMMADIEEESRSAVLFTGFHGDKVWDRCTSGDYLSADVKRGDVSGLDLSEIRLWAGVVNVAVPFIHAESIRDLVRISNSPEMASWRLGNDYDRPIPRRIVEEAGIPRTAFGRQKKAALISYRLPLNRETRAMFLSVLAKYYKRPPIFFPFHRRVNLAAFRIGVRTNRARKILGREARQLPSNRFWKEIQLPYSLHTWSINALAEEMCPALQNPELEHIRDRLRASTESV